MSLILLKVLLILNPTLASVDSRWSIQDHLIVNFKEQKVRINFYQTKAETIMSETSHEGALAVCSVKNTKCEISNIGYRDPNIGVSYPFSNSELTPFPISKKGEQLLKVISSYHHGYSEEIMQLYDLLPGGKELKLVWHQTVNSVSPLGDKEDKKVTFNPTLNKLTLKGKEVTLEWKWDADKKVMIPL